jgi:serine protease Do
MMDMNSSKRRSLVSAFFALLLGVLAADRSNAQALDPENLFEKISPSIWVVTTFDGNERRLAQGSAVVIDIGTLITNCHVLAKAKSFVVKRENVIYGAALVHADVERDLCQIQVRNFNAPAVELATTSSLRVGQRVYAIGNPRGLELSLSDGLISGLRRADDDKTVELIQTTAPISPGSSGGGLFDAQGRLVGITTAIRKDSQNLNFAMPGDWIREVPARARDALAKRHSGDTKQAPAGQPVPRKGSYYVGQTWSYLVVDRMTNLRTPAVLRVDRFDGDNVVFNGGSRVENNQGQVLHADGRLLSELDGLNSIGGWIHGGNIDARSWSITTAASGPTSNRFELTAAFVGTSRIATPAGEFEAVVYRFNGYRRFQVAQWPSSSSYEATAWFAPSIGRVVKFVATAPGTALRIDEEVVLERFDR